MSMYRNRGQWRPAMKAATIAPRLPPDRNLIEGLCQPAVKTIEKPAVDLADDEVEVKDLKYIGSYNWIESKIPTIIVPGSPPEWQNKAMPFRVPADTGLCFSDQNGYRVPSATLLPLIKAVEMKAEYDGSPGFDWSSVDFITDRNGLRKLLRWIDDPDAREFRIDMQLAGKRTVLFNRWEKRAREELSGFTFGYGFEKASTRPAHGCADSTGHHRIVAYDLAGLRMVVRFEVDACIPPPASGSTAVREAKINTDDLAGALANMTLSSSSAASSLTVPDRRSDTKSELTVRKGGSYDVRQSSIVEMTTRSEKRVEAFNWTEAYPQLFLSQTPHHFLALHQRGLFTAVQKRKLGSADLAAVEKRAQPSLQKLRRILQVIHEIVVEGGQRGRLTLLCRDGELKVYERDSQDSCLPDDSMRQLEV